MTRYDGSWAMDRPVEGFQRLGMTDFRIIRPSQYDVVQVSGGPNSSYSYNRSRLEIAYDPSAVLNGHPAGGSQGDLVVASEFPEAQTINLDTLLTAVRVHEGLQGELGYESHWTNGFKFLTETPKSMLADNIQLVPGMERYVSPCSVADYTSAVLSTISTIENDASSACATCPPITMPILPQTEPVLFWDVDDEGYTRPVYIWETCEIEE